MISMKQFYLIGGIAMVISVAGSIWNLILIWDILTIGAKISSIASGVFFQGLLALVFLGMWKMTPDKMVEDNQLDDLVKQIEEEQKKNVR